MVNNVIDVMKKITVFTPTYNRAYCLDQLYDSLCNQTSNDFKWLIIDDGSCDGTKDLVCEWIQENKIEIQYYYKKNGGMHTAHNSAYDLIKTELNVCIDSDDQMTLNAIEKINSFWDNNRDNNYAGIIGLDIFKNGKIVSNRSFPTNTMSGKYSQLLGKYGLKGDIKFIYVTDIIKKYPKYPVYEDEKFVPLGYKYLLIDEEYDLLYLNEPICVVEYLPDGSTQNIIKQYFNNPKGFLFERNIRLLKAYTFKERVKNAIHYGATAIILKQISLIFKSKNKSLTVLCFPIAILLFFYLKTENDRKRKS